MAVNRQGDATRARLVKAAEKLFAAHGVEAVSVRAVNADAGLGAASVHYHFGSKDDLLAAVLVDLGAAVRDQIRANVDALASAPEPPDTESLVRAVTDPYLQLLTRHRTRGMRWIKIIAQISQQGHPAMRAVDQHVTEAVMAQVRRAFPDADPARIELRWAISIMGFLQALSRADEWSRNGRRLPDAELAAFYEDLVDFVSGGVANLLGP
ncbi:TetR/AcrR family transcriptional regulator [Mycolicibacter longobardus]|uniref:TetR family transcriptional regulator n=1 Tax=Mycolicibacter longobardus TaxID=1108812 RepID=A0A1X1Y622_9MYCO|nr:TetR/AcrR family transcriptional regulator [Mycolicibacter longobardus]MCV7382947.1 TetR/AcrR family transcriptional regulator [Mycolicibacter longobardus]ORW06470.1 TetR family transcriptional regulator [Mycolicibacter longobardus]